jgi:hypothetical protein
VLHEILMLVIPKLADNFPLDILVAVVRARSRHVLCRRHVVSDGINLLVGDRHCWRVVDVFEFCLRDGRVDIRFGGELNKLRPPTS